MGLRAKSRIKSASKAVDDYVKENTRQRPLPEKPEIVEAVPATEAEMSRRKSTNFEKVVVTGTKGIKYTLMVPKSFVKMVPRQWEWTEERYEVADEIARGTPIKDIAGDPRWSIKSRMVIYGWLEHPEFREHVDGLIMETGFASKRERISALTTLTTKMFNKLANDIEKIKLSDKGAGQVANALLAAMKQLAQEKEEFVEQSNVTQQTNLSASINVVEAKFEDIMKNKTEEERKAMEAEFDAVGDELIRKITGDKP